MSVLSQHIADLGETTRRSIAALNHALYGDNI